MNILVTQVEELRDSNSDVLVKPFIIDYPIARRSCFLKADIDDHANVDFAKYFGLNSVQISKTNEGFADSVFVKQIKLDRRQK